MYWVGIPRAWHYQTHVWFTKTVYMLSGLKQLWMCAYPILINVINSNYLYDNSWIFLANWKMFVPKLFSRALRLLEARGKEDKIVCVLELYSKSTDQQSDNNNFLSSKYLTESSKWSEHICWSLSRSRSAECLEIIGILKGVIPLSGPLYLVIFLSLIIFSY